MGFSKDVSNIKYIFQYNKESFIVVGFTTNSMVSSPVLYRSFSTLKNDETLNYNIFLEKCDISFMN